MVSVSPQAASKLSSTVVSQIPKDVPKEFAQEPGAERKMLELKERGGTEAGVKAHLSSCIHPAGPWCVLLAHPTPSSSSLAFYMPIFPLRSLLSRPFPSLIYVI